MNDAALKNFATWARIKLLMDVRTRAATYRIDADGAQADAVARVDGEVLSPQEQRQRADLLRMVRAEGFDALMERAAYTWFNRILAIRFMEVNDRLPSGVRLFSTGDGAFSRRTQAIEEALSLDIEGLDRQQVLGAIQASSDEWLFRVLFLAQCAELSACMPAVFEPIGSAMELLLPDNLLATDGVIQHLVEDIPEQDWCEGVEIVGWMYQYYNAERKREVFDGYQKGKKALREDIPAATQIFTPEWIVRFMVENSLGRLWMLNSPASLLSETMRYYISPIEGMREDHLRFGSLEDLTVCDPACGSGHILVYAFDLLAAMYDEAGYSRRDIPRLILEKNLTGFEIDPRAAQMASFALTMKACEVDARFLRRAVAPHIVVLHRIDLDEEDLARTPHAAARKQLVDAIAHLDECGSLLAPSEDDIRAIEDDLAMLSGGGGDLFADATLTKLKIMQQLCNELSRTFDVVIANPPYMGSSNMDKWLSSWTKKTYPNTRRDLCTCFIERCCKALNKGGYTGLTTTNSWMFLSSFEKLREGILSKRTLSSLVQLSVHGFKGIAAQICTFVIAEDHSDTAMGGFVRLDSFDHHSLQEPKTLEAIANPDCGWFYRRSAQDFKSIPGTPIAYWASEAVRRAFENNPCLGSLSSPVEGMKTGNNDLCLRLWFEVERRKESLTCRDELDSVWRCTTKGGDFRRWYGNLEYVCLWGDNGILIDGREGSSVGHRELLFSPAFTWTYISSGRFAAREGISISLYNNKGPSCYTSKDLLPYLLAAMNSSCVQSFLDITSPTLDYKPGGVGLTPIAISRKTSIDGIASSSVSISNRDWDLFETSWDFKRHPLV